MTAERDIPAGWVLYGLLAACAVGLVVHSLQYNFVTDDAFISFVYSRNLAEHGALVFNPGDAVEGYTNFLWTFLLGVLMFVGLPPEIMSRVLGTGFGIGTLIVAFFLIRHINKRPSYWDPLAAAFLAMSSGFACWSSGGLETQMFTFLVAYALYSYVRADSDQRWLRRTTIVLALAAMTRPEGLLVLGVVGLHRVALNVIRDRRFVPTTYELSAVGYFFAMWLPWFAWRWWFYGHPFPNTYYVKAAGAIGYRGNYGAEMLGQGWFYVHSWLEQSLVLYISPVIVSGLAVAKPRTPRFVFGSLALVLALVYAGYTVRVGGDFMGLHRFIMPLFFIAAVGFVCGLIFLTSLVPAGSLRASAVAVVVSIALILSAGLQTDLTIRALKVSSTRGIDSPGYLEVYTHDRISIGKHMNGCFRDEDFSIYGGVGAKPYYARGHGIDVFGLVSWDIAHCQPRTRPRPGHNKWGSSPLLAKQPRRDKRACPPKRDLGNREVFDWSKVDGGPPDFVFSCYAIDDGTNQRPRMCGPPGSGYVRVTLHIGCDQHVHSRHGPEWTPALPPLLERGPRNQFYTFWMREDHTLPETCKGIVER